MIKTDVLGCKHNIVVSNTNAYIYYSYDKVVSIYNKLHKELYIANVIYNSSTTYKGLYMFLNKYVGLYTAFNRKYIEDLKSGKAMLPELKVILMDREQNA